MYTSVRRPKICWAEFKKPDPLLQRPAREEQRGRSVEWFTNETSRLEVVNRELVEAEERYKQCLLDLYGAEYIHEVYGADEGHADTATPHQESSLPPPVPHPHVAVQRPSSPLRLGYTSYDPRKRNITSIFDIHGNRVALKQEPVVAATATPSFAPSQEELQGTMVEAGLVQPQPVDQEEVVVVAATVTPSVVPSQEQLQGTMVEAGLVQPQPVDQEEVVVVAATVTPSVVPSQEEPQGTMVEAGLVQPQPVDQEEVVVVAATVTPSVVPSQEKPQGTMVEAGLVQPQPVDQEEVVVVAATVTPSVVPSQEEPQGTMVEAGLVHSQPVDQEVVVVVAATVTFTAEMVEAVQQQQQQQQEDEEVVLDQQVVGSALAAPAGELQAAVDVTCQVTLKEGAVHGKPAKGRSSKLKALKKAMGAAWRTTQDKSWQLMKKISFISRGAPASKALAARVFCGCFGF
eukprot:jgi/Chrzof1/8562/Cz03g15220.t1